MWPCVVPSKQIHTAHLQRRPLQPRQERSCTDWVIKQISAGWPCTKPGVLHMEDGRRQPKKEVLASDGGSSHKEGAVLPVEAKRHWAFFWKCDCQWRWKAVEEVVRDYIFRQKSLFGYNAPVECLHIMQWIPLWWGGKWDNPGATQGFAHICKRSNYSVKRTFNDLWSSLFLSPQIALKTFSCSHLSSWSVNAGSPEHFLPRYLIHRSIIFIFFFQNYH